MSEESARIINTWDQLTAAVAAKIIPKKHALAISYQAPARHVVSAGVFIWSPFFETDPKAAWYDHGRATFSDDRDVGTVQAREWAAARGYTGGWARNAFRDWVPTVVQENFPIKRRSK
jgi:hypothetical protein